MKLNKRNVITLATLLFVLVIAVGSVLILVNNNKGGSNGGGAGNMATITFDTGDGFKLDPMEVKKGSSVGKLPQSFLAGYAFVGWYSDAERTKPFYNDTEINEDLILYASYVEFPTEFYEDDVTSYYKENCNTDFSITVINESGFSKARFLSAVVLQVIFGDNPNLNVEEVGVDANGIASKFVLSAVGGFTAGGKYKLTICDGLRYDGFEETVVDYVFDIYKAPVQNVELKDSIKYVDRNDVIFIDGNYKFNLPYESVSKYNLVEGDVLCLGNGIAFTEGSVFVKVSETYVNGNNLLVSAVDAEIEDVYQSVDVNFKQAMDAETIISQLDEELIAEQIANSVGFEETTMMLSALIADSPTVSDMLAVRGGDFADCAYVKEETMKGLKVQFAKGAKVSVQIGGAYNPNFDPIYTEDFCAIRVSLDYEATLKNKIQIQANLTIVEYLMISMQGRMDYSIIKWWLDFEYELNLYTQTDIDLTVLVRSVDKNEEKYRDIGQEIKDRLAGEEEAVDDEGSLVRQVRDLLSSKDGYIELFKAPIIRANFPVPAILPVFSVNTYIDFVVKLNFAAGINMDISVLQAKQVGMVGDTREKNLSAVENDLPGGKRYSMEMEACGYLGLKAGFEGSLTISFNGLSQFGEVGISIFFGPYLDMYGYAKFSLLKYDSTTNCTLVGGYFIDIGLNLEIKLIARVDAFDLEAGLVLFEHKWSLVSFGNKLVLLSIDEIKDKEVIIRSDQSQSAELGNYDYAYMPNVSGKFLNITTGEVTTGEIPWDKLFLRFSDHSGFSFDRNRRLMSYNTNSHPNENVVSVDVEYYYEGQYLDFGKKSNPKFGSLVGNIKVTWVNVDKVDPDAVGKTFNVNYHINIDGNKKFITSKSVLGGNVACGAGGIGYSSIYVNGQWDKDPYETIINEDTDFVWYANMAQYRVAFIYFDEENYNWKAEVRAVKLDSQPQPPTLPQGQKSKFTGWGWKKGWNCISDTVDTSGALPTISSKLGGYALGSNWLLKDVGADEVLVSVTSDNSVSAEMALYQTKMENGDPYGSQTMLFFIANYSFDNCELTIVERDYNNEKVEKHYSVNYGKTYFNYVIWNTPVGMKFTGLSATDGGEIVYEYYRTIISIREDTVLYAVYEPKPFTVSVYAFDGEKQKLVQCENRTVLGGDKVPQEMLENAKNALVAESGVNYNFIKWVIHTGKGWDSDFDIETKVVYNLSIKPIYERVVEVNLDAKGGTLPSGEFKLYSSSLDFYSLRLPTNVEKERTNYKTFTFKGWKNVETGEFFSIARLAYPIDVDNPASFEAVYDETEIEYRLNIYTTYGVLQNGKDVHSYVGGYDGYIEIINQYENGNWLPQSYDSVEDGCLYTPKTPNIGKNALYDCIELINYCNWNKIMHKHTLSVDANGGVLETEVSAEFEWGTEFGLYNIKASKEDDLCVYELVGWLDQDGKEYAVNGFVEIKKDITISAIWKEKTYKEYVLQLYINEQKIDEVVYHKNDTIDKLSIPQTALGKVFSGWKVYKVDAQSGELVELDSIPTTMPSANLVAKATATEVYVIYVVDGVEIERVAGYVGSTIEVKATYVKKGYTVQDWTTADVNVEENAFVMPEKNVTFSANTFVNKYNATFYHNGEIYLAISVDYGSFVTLPELPQAESGVYLAWASDDVAFVGGAFYMPDKDVAISTINATEKYHIIYVVDGEIIGYDMAIPKQSVTLRNGLEDNADGGKFSNWYSSDVDLINQSGDAGENANVSFIMPNNDVMIYGTFGFCSEDASGSENNIIKINFYLSSGNNGNQSESGEESVAESTKADFVIYAKDGDVLNPYVPDKGTQTFGCWSIGDSRIEKIAVDEQVTIMAKANNNEINAYAIYNEKQYEVSFNYNASVIKENYSKIYAFAGDKVYTPTLPSGEESENVKQVIQGWFAGGDVEFGEDESGKYFIMPKHNVVLTAVSQYVDKEDEQSYNAVVYLRTPYSAKPIPFATYAITTDIVPVYLDAPEVYGCDFINWTDENGNPLVGEYGAEFGLTLSYMNGADRVFYGNFKASKLKVIEFVLNGEHYAYRLMFGQRSENIDVPTVSLADGEQFSRWTSPLGSAYDFGIELSSGSDCDLTFYGYTYSENAEFEIAVSLNMEDYGSGYNLKADANQTLIFDANLSGYNIVYTVTVTGGVELSDGTYESVEFVANLNERTENGRFMFTLASIENLKVDGLEGYTISNVQYEVVATITAK